VPVHALVAVGVDADGHRQVLRIQVTTSEDGAGWVGFFRDLSAAACPGASWSPPTLISGSSPRSQPRCQARPGKAVPEGGGGGMAWVQSQAPR